MKVRLLFSSFVLVTVLSLLGCSNKQESKELQAPPGLSVLVGEKTISPARGSYSWTHTNDDGTSTSVNADSGPPPALVENQQPMNVTADTNVELIFVKPPKSYSVRIWNTDTSMKINSDKINLSNKQGKVIYEVLAEWEKGTATYAFSLNVKK